MRIVDEKYKYDEMEGFEVLEPGRSPLRMEMVMMSIHERTLTLSKAAMEILGHPEYILVMTDAEGMRMLVKPSEGTDRRALMLRYRTKENRIKNVTESTALMRKVESIVRRDLATVNLTAAGKAVKSMPGAVIFDLKHAVYEKKRKYTNLRKKAA